jgi:hypothetical protein
MMQFLFELSVKVATALWRRPGSGSPAAAIDFWGMDKFELFQMQNDKISHNATIKFPS